MSVSFLTLLLEFDNRTFSLASGLRAVLTVGDLVCLLPLTPIGMKDLGGALATTGTLTTGDGDAFGGLDTTIGAGFEGASTVL
jgi:hypothetical protein